MILRSSIKRCFYISRLLLLLSGFIAFASYAAGKPTVAYLPDGIELDPTIPTPESVIGFKVGEWHIRHDLLVNYMRALAEASDRISLQVTGYTHEQRPLLLLTITAPKNQNKLEAWRKANVEQVFEGKKLKQDAPLFLYMGYSVHGNEPSGSNASLLLAYYLAASKDPRVTELLANNVVLLDPSFNPDGLSRFAQWANMHKGKVLSADPLHREHDEGWPNGRTNHYWFDLNRDWLMMVHPESEARIKQYQHWRPHILTDYHEMRPDSSYFFQPGVASRKNPLTPEGNVRLTNALAEFYVKAFDQQNRLYFSQEGYDDFYYGKGSTYPDAQGSIGILFEQASSRGHLQSTINGPLSFEQTIQNQLTMSLALFDGAMANKAAIIDYQHQFYNDTQSLIKDDELAGFVLNEPLDNWRLEKAKWVLAQHNIEYIVPAQTVTADGQQFAAQQTIIIPLDQPQYRLVKSLFSTQQSFVDNTFYDVSNWNLPLAFDLDYASITSRELKRVKTSQLVKSETNLLSLDKNAYGYAFRWHHYKAPALLQQLFDAGVNARVATKSFTALTTHGEQVFTTGTIAIPRGIPQPDKLSEIVSSAAQHSGLPVFSLQSGSTSSGIDIGSRSMVPLTPPKVLVIGGDGTSPYQVGEIWHYLDTQVAMPITLVEQAKLSGVKLDHYSHIIFASGRYELNDDVTEKIADWVRKGGTLIGQMSAMRLFSRLHWLDVDISTSKEITDLFSQKNLAYGDKAAYEAQQLIAGAVYKANIDTSHPLFYGFDKAVLHLFKASNMIVNSRQPSVVVPARYTKEPLVAGYSADVLAREISESVAVIAQPMGSGQVIGFTDDPQFRGFWYGTNKLMSNAIFFADVIE